MQHPPQVDEGRRHLGEDEHEAVHERGAHVDARAEAQHACHVGMVWEGGNAGVKMNPLYLIHQSLYR